MKMWAARMYGYKEPLRLDEVPVPDVGAGEVLIKVAAAGMCRSDYQLMDGYFQQGLPVEFPITPGHEVAGAIAAVGADVPQSAGLAEGELIVVDPNWGDGVCRQCHEGNEQLCSDGRLVGFGPSGGFAEYMVVPHRHVIAVPEWPDRKPETYSTDSFVTRCGSVK